MYKKYVLVLISYCLLLAIIGCSKNPLAPVGSIGFAGENKTLITTNSYFSKTISKGIGPGLHFPIELTVIIEKIEITTTGEKWIEIFKGSTELKITDSDTTAKIVVFPVPVSSDEYHGVRIWFGDKIKVKGTVEIYNGARYTGIMETLEKERSGISTCNPVTFTTADFNFDAFDINRGKEIFIVFRFPLRSIVYDAIGDGWNSADFSGIDIRTTRIGG